MHDHMAIFIGSAFGLILANLLGIFAGKLLFSKLSKEHIKIASSIIFFLFGSTTLFETISGSFLLYTSYSIVLTLLAYFIYTSSRKVKI